MIDTAVTQERPPAAHRFASCEVHVDDVYCLFLPKFAEQFTLRTSHEATSPEADALGLPRRIIFVSHTIDRDDRETIGYSMPTLDQLPRITLTA